MARRKTAESNKVVSLRRHDPAAVPGARVGWVMGLSVDGNVVVEVPGIPGPRIARATVVLTPAQLDPDARTEVLVLFDQGGGQPIIIGVMRTQPSTDAPARPRVQPLTADVDGNRVTLTAEHEIVLKCGDAEIVLRKNGRILIRGVHVETRSKGLNRIKGGAVHIN